MFSLAKKAAGTNSHESCATAKIQQIQVVRSLGGRIKLAVQTDRGIFYLEKDEVRSAFSAEAPFSPATLKGNNPHGVMPLSVVLGHGVIKSNRLSSLSAVRLDKSRILNLPSWHSNPAPA